METFNPLNLREEELRRLPPGPIADEIIGLICRKQRQKFNLSQDVLTHEYKIQSSGYVGLIPLNEKYSLRITPKVSIGNIFRMLEYAYKLKQFELLEGCVNLDSIQDVFERLASILAKKILDRNRKGLYRGYLQQTQSLFYLRGKMQIKPSLISMFKGSMHPICKYEENTADLEENEILLWTLYKLHQFEIKREEIKRAVRLAYRELVNKAALTPFSPQDCINRYYNRLNIDYKPMHGICRFLLEHTGPTLEQGSHDFLPFTIYMPTLFETFVVEWLKEKLPKKYHLTPQYKAVLDPEKNLEFRIDLVLSNFKRTEAFCVIDTKYKKTETSRAQDVAQVVAYATKMRTTKAFLVYPSREISSFNFPVGDVQVKSLSFDISKDVEQSGAQFLNSLLSCLE